MGLVVIVRIRSVPVVGVSAAVVINALLLFLFFGDDSHFAKVGYSCSGGASQARTSRDAMLDA